jgi:hypothetical protein
VKAWSFRSWKARSVTNLARRVAGRRAVITSNVTEEQVRSSMAIHRGVKERVWRELGLPSRFALRRLLTKLGIADDVDDEVSRVE